MRWGDGAYHARNNGLENDIRYRAVHATRSVHLSYQGNYAYSVNHRAGKSFYTARDGQPDGLLGAREIGSSRYITQTHRLGAVWRHGGHQLGIDGSWHGEPYQGLANQRMDVIRNHTSTTGLRYQGDFGWGDVSARVWQQHARIDLGMGRDRQPADGLSSRLHGRDVGVNLKASVYVSPRDILRVGVDALYDRLDQGWRVNGAAGASGRTMVLTLDDGRRERVSGFGEWERRWNGQWDTLVGVRATRVTTRAGSVQQAELLPNGAADVAAFNAHGRHTRDSHGDFSVLAGFAPTLGQRYEIGVSRNTRSPSLAERYAWSTDPLVSSVTGLAGDGNGYLGNPDLKPEVATSAVAAAHWNPAEDPLAWGLSVSAHASRIRDYIDAERCPDSLCGAGNATATNQFVMLRHVNQDARIWGVDVWGHYRLVDFSLQGAYMMTGRMSWLRGRNEETRSGLYGIAPASIRLALEREQFFLFGLNKTTLEWEHVRASRDLPAARNAIPTEGFGLLHLRHRFALGGFGVDSGVENLLNRRYARPLGGAYLGQGDTRGLNTAAWGIPMPGQGRSFYFGLTYRM